MHTETFLVLSLLDRRPTSPGQITLCLPWGRILNISMQTHGLDNWISSSIMLTRMDELMPCIQPLPFTLMRSMLQMNLGLSRLMTSFHNYVDGANAYWTGYFTSRPALKGYVRVLSGYYLAARQLEFLTSRNNSGPTTDSLADALAVAQHHEAITGTEKQHVANDYAKRLSIGYTEAEKLVGSSLFSLTESASISQCLNSVTKFEQCPLLNLSYCPPSESNLSNGKSLVALVYNSLGWKREDVIRIPSMEFHN